ncbi:hypothetical protein PF002_g15736 [Phytophthora fragariae]|uniref:DDE Tnp4 domain-containing protein n=2 Tax=Phytophthora fragariae TaxID=53985 RepID=A0A6A3YMB2_9STRA|nr:hypothetical protein PF007_g26806 [Phytophthora fragariae]KAE9220922.1 hypothetical protein PF002_g15736 [Phytophthora fragariae]KAE9279083.1 hypothetical protein PF001_g24877 [Phytophthora fragariae]
MYAGEDWRASIQRLREINAECEEDEAAEMVAMAAINSSASLLAQDAVPWKRGGSTPGRSPNAERNHVAGHNQLYNDYFASDPVYNDRLFRRRFRMTRRVLDRLLNGVLEVDDYFRQRPDAAGNPGLSALQKVTAALRIVCYGVAAVATDEYLRIGASTAAEAFRHFIAAVLTKFGAEYLRQPTAADIKRHTDINKLRGFPGMFGSLDCTHWVWKNCPVGWQGMFQDKDGDRSIIMEAVATRNLWIRHSYAGIPGSNNDINVIDRSPFMVNWLQGNAPDHKYQINGHDYKMCYLLCDGIYPAWSVFVKTISSPTDAKQRLYAKMQEAARKDVERCFGVLQARFALLAQPARFWEQGTLEDVWYACVVMHNMIVEDEEGDTEAHADNYLETFEAPSIANAGVTFDTLLMQLADVHDVVAQTALQADLVEHLWERNQALDL